MNEFRNKRINSGFTLIELLVVITILGILATLVIVNVAGTRERARDATRKSDLNQIKTALRMYYNDNNGYPASDGDYQITCQDNSSVLWGSAFTCNNVTYMKLLPNDPISGSVAGQVYHYQRPALNKNEFCLWVTLENSSDSEVARSRVQCANICQNAAATDYQVCAD